MRLYDYAGILLATETEVSGLYRAAKRMLDLVTAGVLVVLAAPFLGLIALAILVDSRGGVFFRQMRSLGAGSKVVPVLKFRSMKSVEHQLIARDRMRTVLRRPRMIQG